MITVIICLVITSICFIVTIFCFIKAGKNIRCRNKLFADSLLMRRKECDRAREELEANKELRNEKI